MFWKATATYSVSEIKDILIFQSLLPPASLPRTSSSAVLWSAKGGRFPTCRRTPGVPSCRGWHVAEVDMITLVTVSILCTWQLWCGNPQTLLCILLSARYHHLVLFLQWESRVAKRSVTGAQRENLEWTPDSVFWNSLRPHFPYLN